MAAPPTGSIRAVGLLLATALVAMACSARHPALIGPSGGTGGLASEAVSITQALPPPQRAECDPTLGLGPGSLTLGTEGSVAGLLPCVAVAAHQRVELANGVGRSVEVTVGATSLTLADGERATTEPAGTVLSPGPNRVLVGPDPLATVWLVEPSEAPLAGSVIGLSSMGGIELGQTAPAVTEAAGIPVPASAESCHQTSLGGSPYSPLLTFQDGSLAVVQVFTPGLTTVSGIGIGDTGADVQAAYGDRVTPVPAPDGDPDRQLLVFTPNDEDDQIYRLVFDLTGDRVTTMRFGAAEIVAEQPDCRP